MEHLVTTNTDVVALYRFHPSMLPRKTTGLPAGCKKGIFLDTETTGLGPAAKVVEIALIPFWFNQNGLQTVEPSVVYLQDPGIPIPEEATQTNGITDEMVAGKQADWGRVQKLLLYADIVLCHNTRYDRPVVHRSLVEYGQEVPPQLWGCSMAQVPWRKVLPHPPSVALGALCAWAGFFFPAHRADIDCLAALYLLHKTNQLWDLYQTARAPQYRLRALGAPFDQKDILKERGYQWDSSFANANGKMGVWSISKTTQEEMEAERAWLTLVVYRGTFRGSCALVPPEENFL